MEIWKQFCCVICLINVVAELWCKGLSEKALLWLILFWVIM